MLVPAPDSGGSARRPPPASATIAVAMLFCALWVVVEEPTHRHEVETSVERLEAIVSADPEARVQVADLGELPDQWRSDLAHLVTEAGPSSPALRAAIADLTDRVHALPSWRWGWVPARPTVLGSITYLFIHTELLHLLSNLVLCWLLGSTLEARHGPRRPLTLFVASGVAGALTHSVVYGETMVPLIGASASAAGLLAGLLVGRPPRVLPFVFMAPAGARAAAMRFEIPLKALVWVWVGLEALTFLEPSAHPSATPAHLGGLLAGGLLATAMGRRQSP